MIKNKFIVTFILLMAFSVIAYNIYFFLNRKEKSAAAKKNLFIPKAVQKKETKVETKFIEKDNKSWRRNPFLMKHKPLKIESFANIEEKINVEAIIIGNNKGYAIVNGKMVKVGDKIADSVVTEISRYQIKLSSGDGCKVFYIW